VAVSIAELIGLSLLADWLFRRLGMPGLIGMLLVGVALGPFALGAIDPSLLAIGADLRVIALIVILLRVGLELSRATLHRVGRHVLLLAFVPAVIEMSAVALVGSRLLGLTPLESLVLGTVLAAVSPAVIVPAMLRFKALRRGEAKDVPSLVMAAASVDDVFVIVVHSAVLGLYVGQHTGVAMQIASVPLALVAGAVVGLGAGLLLYHVFVRFNPRATKRALAMIALSILIAVRLDDLLAGVFPFAGLVAAMVIGFVILERDEAMAHELSTKLAKVWIFAEIVLFAMVGAEVDVRLAWQAGLVGALTIAVGLIGRFAGVWACLLGSTLDARERLFVAIAFSPKATVQAAIGASPLLAMRAAGLDTVPGDLILAIAVLSIVLTAPLGAWALRRFGERLLGPPGPVPRQAQR